MRNVVHLFNLDPIATEQESSRRGQTKYERRGSISYANKSTFADGENVAWTFFRQP